MLLLNPSLKDLKTTQKGRGEARESPVVGGGGKEDPPFPTFYHAIETKLS